MRFKIPGVNNASEELADEAGYLAGRSLAAEGESEQLAFFTGHRAGAYAGQYLLSALERAGLVDLSGVDVEALKAQMRELDSESGVASELGHRPLVVRIL